MAEPAGTSARTSPEREPGAIRLEWVSCPKCDADESIRVVAAPDYLHHIPGDYVVAECRRCGLWFQNPRPAQDQLDRLYPPDYGPHSISEPESQLGRVEVALLDYLGRRMGYRHLLARREVALFLRALPYRDTLLRWLAGTRLLPRFAPGGKVLEIGCGSGGFLALLRRLGWQDLVGIELVESAADQARSAGVVVECGQVEEVLHRYPDAYFDVVVSSMVVEHLRNPFETVRQISRKLKGGGQFLFSTITRDALDAKLYGQYWSGLDLPRHMVYLRKRDIREMLHSQFMQVELFHQAAPVDFVRSSTWRSPLGKPLDRLVLALAPSPLAPLGGVLLAWFGLTCRIAYRCRKVADV